MTPALPYRPRTSRRKLAARILALTATLLSLLGALLAGATAPARAADVIVSQGKAVTVSSVESSATPASAAVDGDGGTRWSSGFAATQWLQVDLGAAGPVSQLDISWEAAYAKAFTIQLSTDGGTYTQAYATTSGAGGQQGIALAGTARYVRINLTTRALSAYGYSIWEFQVHGTAAAPPGTGSTVGGVALVNDVSKKPVLGLSPLVDGSVVDLTKLANRDLSIQASLAHGATAGSLTFTLTGAKGSSYTRTENTAPYFLCNDYVDCPLLATADAYTLTVQAYAGTDATGGAKGAPLVVHFSVSATAVAAPALDVLFVGNSLLGTATAATGEDTLALVRHMATAAGRTVRVTEVIHFGNTLQQTYDAGEVTAALSGATRYDYIVLQEYSTLVATDPASAADTLMNTYAPAFGRPQAGRQGGAFQGLGAGGPVALRYSRRGDRRDQQRVHGAVERSADAEPGGAHQRRVRGRHRLEGHVVPDRGRRQAPERHGDLPGRRDALRHPLPRVAAECRRPLPAGRDGVVHARGGGRRDRLLNAAARPRVRG